MPRQKTDGQQVSDICQSSGSLWNVNPHRSYGSVLFPCLMTVEDVNIKYWWRDGEMQFRISSGLTERH